MFGKILVDKEELNRLENRIVDLEERFFKQEIDEIIEELEADIDKELRLRYDWYRHTVSVSVSGIYDRDFATLSFENYRDLLITIKKERQNIINAIKVYLYDKQKEEEKIYAKL